MPYLTNANIHTYHACALREEYIEEMQQTRSRYALELLGINKARRGGELGTKGLASARTDICYSHCTAILQRLQCTLIRYAGPPSAWLHILSRYECVQRRCTYPATASMTTGSIIVAPRHCYTSTAHPSRPPPLLSIPLPRTFMKVPSSQTHASDITHKRT
jgi:hypothetical protein